MTITILDTTSNDSWLKPALLERLAKHYDRVFVFDTVHANYGRELDRGGVNKEVTERISIHHSNGDVDDLVKFLDNVKEIGGNKALVIRNFIDVVGFSKALSREEHDDNISRAMSAIKESGIDAFLYVAYTDHFPGPSHGDPDHVREGGSYEELKNRQYDRRFKDHAGISGVERVDFVDYLESAGINVEKAWNRFR
jgi:hypothetical protein